MLAQKIAQVPGVGQVGVGGGIQPRRARQVDPQLLAGMGLGIEDVRTAIRPRPSNQPKGGVGADRSGTRSAPTTSSVDAAAWRQVIVRWAAPGGAGDGGGAVRLGDVATVTDDVENSRVAGWFDGERVDAP